MTAAVFEVHRHPPPLYRLARALRRLSLIVLVVLILYTVTVAYSTYETAKSASNLSSFSESFEPNGTVLLSATLTLNNNGFYPVQHLTLSVRLTNASGTLVGATVLGPTNLPSQATTVYPVDVFFPVSGTGAGPSLLTQDQPLPVRVWANATFGYLFPAGLALYETRSWGAPFADLNFSAGAPTENPNGTATVPVTLSFQNNAPLTEVGSLDFALLSSSRATCGTGSFALDVPQNTPYSQTTPVTLAAGCSPAGGVATSMFVTPDYTIVLPPESIP